MAVGLKPPAVLHSIDGIKLAALHSGIKADRSKNDLVLIEIAASASLSAIFTTNKFCAAPVTVCREHLAWQGDKRFLLINSGNANAGTGLPGYQNALNCCQSVADYSQLPCESVLPFSTGVIASQLPTAAIQAAIPELFSNLKQDNWLSAANGIMTTDTLPKAISEQVLIGGKPVTITGIAKGSGMIKPDMATMLAFVATDAEIDRDLLNQYLKQAADISFNSITVDGDTSTNDACVLIATGSSGIKLGRDCDSFSQGLTKVFLHLAHSIIRDAEGASKFVEIEVQQALSIDDAREVAYTIAHSPLVKTALFASDPNWGRILAAIGRAKIDALEVEKIDLFLGKTCLLQNGLPDKNYEEESGQAEMNNDEIKIRVVLKQGQFNARIWTSDLSYDYVKINAEYRS